MSLLIEFTGWSAAFLVLSGYVASTNGWLTPKDWRYQVINLVGAAQFIFYTGMHHTWAPMALNAIWFAVALAALLRMSRRAAGA
jgi:hypothetical protein